MRSIKNCINKQLLTICQRSLQLEELQNKITRFLPAELAKACQVGNFDKGCLTLTTTDASWASQLRYLVFELRDRLRNEAGLYQLLSIKVLLIEPLAPYEKTIGSVNHQLSSKAKDCIIAQGHECKYPPLKNALFRLAGYKNY